MKYILFFAVTLFVFPCNGFAGNENIFLRSYSFKTAELTIHQAFGTKIQKIYIKNGMVRIEGGDRLLDKRYKIEKDGLSYTVMPDGEVRVASGLPIIFKKVYDKKSKEEQEEIQKNLQNLGPHIPLYNTTHREYIDKVEGDNILGQEVDCYQLDSDHGVLGLQEHCYWHGIEILQASYNEKTDEWDTADEVKEIKIDIELDDSLFEIPGGTKTVLDQRSKDMAWTKKMIEEHIQSVVDGLSNKDATYLETFVVYEK